MTQTVYIRGVDENTDFEYKINDGKLSGPLSDESYFSIEKGTPDIYLHKWHCDTGTGDHMNWCKFGISLLISDPNTFKGAELEYCNLRNAFKKTKKQLINLMLQSLTLE